MRKDMHKSLAVWSANLVCTVDGSSGKEERRRLFVCSKTLELGLVVSGRSVGWLRDHHTRTEYRRTHEMDEIRGWGGGVG